VLSANIRPFDPAHPVYQPIPEGVRLDVNSTAIVRHVAANKASFAFDTRGESPPVYIGKPTDPIYRIGNYQVHVPTNAQPGTGSDRPLVILDENSPQAGGKPVEYRLWQATVSHSTKVITFNGMGVGVYANDGGRYNGKRALGQAEIYGQNTGSGNSYTVGMVRPHEIERGYIDHAIRAAVGYPHSAKWYWPATRTEQQGYAANLDNRLPMGARLFLGVLDDVLPRWNDIDAANPPSFYNALKSRLSNPLNLKLAYVVIKAIQEYGIIALDGTTGGNNLYFEGAGSADWTSVAGPVNSLGSYNDVARAVAAVLPWQLLMVPAESEFDAYGRN
ncbi:MAG: hypothetical protein OJJ55_19150, partial [Rhodococcus sp.]|nr:hypothetical protein [Rhodococcus sp. (in: high G+C Gram-positive bacteria)]